MAGIHPTALIHPNTVLPGDVEVGPYTVIEAGVIVGAGVRVGPFCHLYSGVHLEAGVVLSDGVVLGNAPQDLKYRGENTQVHIGRGTVLREYVTVNRGTAATGSTRIGAQCLVMAYSHVAHDCTLEDRVVVANAVHMGGHVRIGAASVISGMTGIHQFVTIGAGVFIGGGLRVDKDVPPFSKALGEPLAWAGINEIGLAKFAFDAEERRALKFFYREFFAHLGEGGVPTELVDSFFAGVKTPAREHLSEILGRFFRNRSRGLLRRRALPGI